MRRRRMLEALLAGAVLFGAGVSQSACTLVLKADKKQCTSDADCAPFEGTFCSDRNVCVSSLTYCFNNEQCIARNNGQPYICRKTLDHTCAPLLTSQCPRILPNGGEKDLVNDDTVVMGSILMPSWNPILKGAEDGMEMASNDLVSTTGGLPGVGGKPRKLLIVACDIPFAEGAEGAKKATDHLIEDLHVPAIVGPLPSDWLLYTFQRAVATGTVILTPSTVAAESFTDAPGREGILFRTGYAIDSNARAEALAVPAFIEPGIRAIANIPPEQPIKYAVVKSGDGTEETVIAKLFEELKFNGKTVAENGPNYREFNFGDPLDPAFPSNLAATIVDVLDYKPNIVSFYGREEPNGGVVTALIQMEKSNLGAAYLLGTPGVQASLADFVGTNENLRKRIWVKWTGKSSKDPALSRFLQRYQTFNKEAVLTPLAAAGFDCGYFMMYAMASMGTKPITSKGIADGFHLLWGGPTEVTATPADLPKGFGLLQNGTAVSVYGAAGAANFDAKGDIRLDIQFQCIDNTLPGDGFSHFRDTGISYESTTDSLKGTNDCF